jgi:putative flippase GtrA
LRGAAARARDLHSGAARATCFGPFAGWMMIASTPNSVTETTPRSLFRLPGRRFFVFCLVGGSGVLVNMVAFFAVRHFLLGPGVVGDNVAVATGWVLSVASNFTLNHLFTFRESTRGSRIPVARRLFTYYASALAGLGVQWCVFQTCRWAIRAIVGDSANLSQMIGMLHRYEAGLSNLVGIAVATVITYSLSKRVVFKQDA